MGEHAFASLGQIIQEKLTFQALSERTVPLKTGFPQLDASLNGGITPGLIVLGAGPSQGKSTFCLQLAEQVSRNENTPVLYFSLEMSVERVAAKAITMDNFRRQKAAGAAVSDFADEYADKERFFTAAELFNPESLNGMTAEKRQQHEEAQSRSGRNRNLRIIDRPYCARQIVAEVDRFLQSGEAAGRMPLVIVDYLQILPPDPQSRGPVTDKQQVELNMKILRELILKDIPVLLISSLRRGNYSGKKTTPIKEDSFKETGGIEYSADVLMGLQFSACHDRGGCDADAEKEKYPRDVEIVILKQRYGEIRRIPMRYYAPFDYLEEKEPEPEAAAASQKEKAPSTAPAQPETQPEKQPDMQPQLPELSQPKLIPESKREPVVYMNNTKLAYRIRNGQWKSGKKERCNVASSGAEPVYTEFILTGELNSYDCEVADAVYTLYRRDPTGFTLRQLLHVLSGDRKQTLTKQKKAELRKSLKRLMGATLEIDCTQEMVHMRKKPEYAGAKSVVYSGQFINVQQIQDENAPEDGTGRYIFLKKDDTCPMPLYLYGELTTQMLAVPQLLLAAREKGSTKLPDTKDVIIIKRHLIRRLEVIRKGRSSSKHLLQVNYFSQTVNQTSGLLTMLEAERDQFSAAEWTRKVKQAEKTVVGILNGFKDCGYISGFQQQAQTGVTLPKNVKDPFRLELNR